MAAPTRTRGGFFFQGQPVLPVVSCLLTIDSPVLLLLCGLLPYNARLPLLPAL